MIGNKFFLFVVISVFLGSAVSKAVNTTDLKKPSFARNYNKAQPFWDPNFCDDYEDLDVFAHPDSCAKYLICWQGELWEETCSDGMLFDPWELVCDDPDNVICLDDPWPDPEPEPEPENGCPPAGSNELVFLPSYYCDEYYICVNGNPILRSCRDGLHWNMEKEFCDDPWKAGCDPTAEEPPSDPPLDFECPRGVVQQIPYPYNCNKFIHCSDGARSIQRCQHLFHFDIDERRCLFMSVANCSPQARWT